MSQWVLSVQETFTEKLGYGSMADLKDSSQHYNSMTTGYMGRGSKKTDGAHQDNAVEERKHVLETLT